MSLQVNKKLDPRQRLILSALDLLRTQGLAATSVREVAKHAQAPLGSTYHYFPDGKSQIVKEALIFSGNTALEQLDKALNQHGVRKGITVFITWWADMVQADNFEAGCPLMSVLMETGSDPEKLQYVEIVKQILDVWKLRLIQAFEQESICLEQSNQISMSIIASLEGAILLCRAWGSVTPLKAIAEQLDLTIKSLV
ncbi:MULTISPECIES: TetR/AcrR family transcriptional regulator [Acinetobacter]|jgi:AcrR family transcriptional regulator|uniref:TetR/AcrR family transcriptional regulator n=2 Tax=Acinetobacter TaxID=469 RepID=A0A7T4PB53_ACIBZ|nr:MULTISPECIES: TetR/AcrR family transcriptional regulator [Acinetobacter]AVI35284.1 bacterial regulatory, tetR family protein [Acinetobacter baumannii]AVI39397.1 bacterial regulatory, tetR family protein [Acinetobacter baumannii]AWA46556.1 TetR/AcrR family transcriptional regulator [Acinetobacter junii]AZM39926.1 TetR/AcrR family transcriptional regulator [Acinetobacter baumannii]EHU1451400.1 TetR/AcrR family transcriptional regulator [Acinetobacter baumannii]